MNVHDVLDPLAEMKWLLSFAGDGSFAGCLDLESTQRVIALRGRIARMEHRGVFCGVPVQASSSHMLGEPDTSA
jgi:hypothetical protein